MINLMTPSEKVDILKYKVRVLREDVNAKTLEAGGGK